MRLLWARVGVPYSPATGLPIESQTVSQMVDRVLALPEGTRLYLLAPIARGRKGEYRKEFAELQKKGFQRRQGRRQVLRDRRGPYPRQEVQARYRRGGGPRRGAPGHVARGSPTASRRRCSSPTTASPSPNSPTRCRRQLPSPSPLEGEVDRPKAGREGGQRALDGRYARPKPSPDGGGRRPQPRVKPSGSSSRRNSPARSRASPSRRSSRGCSRSTTPMAPAPNATGSAPNCSSSPSWWCQTKI